VIDVAAPPHPVKLTARSPIMKIDRASVRRIRCLLERSRPAGRRTSERVARSTHDLCKARAPSESSSGSR
jgi:hypothetical protein